MFLRGRSQRFVTGNRASLRAALRTRLYTMNGLSLRRFCAAAAAVAAGMSLILASPPPEPSSEKALCVKSVPITVNLRVIENCDSRVFLTLARDPSRLFGDLSLWQSRAGYVALGAMLSRPFIRIQEWTRRAGFGWRSWHPFNAAYLLLNFLVLIAAVTLFSKAATTPGHFIPAALLPIAALIVNEVTKAFFWTAHVQIFNLLIPVLAISLSSWATRRFATRSWPWIVLIGLAMGAASLVYGSFLLLPLTLAVTVVWSAFRVSWKDRFAWVWRLAVALASSAAVILAWRSYVIARTGSFAAHEVQGYRQFVWVVQDAEQGMGTLVTSLLSNLAAFATTLLPTVAGYGCVLVICAVGAASSRISARELVPASMLNATGHYFIVAVPFLFLLGFYRTRLTWLLVPPLLLLTSVALSRIYARLPHRQRRVWSGSSVVATVAYVTFWILHSGPYS
jgi:hypothetical protein